MEEMPDYRLIGKKLFQEIQIKFAMLSSLISEDPIPEISLELSFDIQSAQVGYGKQKRLIVNYTGPFSENLRFGYGETVHCS